MRSTILSAAVAIALAGCGGGSPAQVPTVVHAQTVARSNVAAFMGDSITYYWSADMPTTPYAVNNLGQPGNVTAQMLARFKTQVIDAQPTVGVVVIDGGVNDLLHPESGSKPLDNITEMARMASQAGIRVIVASVMLEQYTAVGIVNPSTAQIDALDDSLIKLCADKGYTYADYRDVMLLTDGTQDFSLYNDGLHPDAAGYARMWAVVDPLIEEALQ